MTPFLFTIVRGGNPHIPAEVSWEVAPGLGSADPDDFGGQLPSGGPVQFNDPDKYLEEITVPVSGDTQIESDDDFMVVLTQPSANASLDLYGQFGHITNDDFGGFSIQAQDANKDEGNAGTVTDFTFEVTRAGALDQPAWVDFSATGYGSNPADWADFSGSISGTLPFAINEPSKIVTIKVAGDNQIEANEGFKVSLSNPRGTTINTDSALGTIQDDDGLHVGITPASASKQEGNSNPGTIPVTDFTFNVTRTGNLTEPLVVTYIVSGTGSHAADSSDFGSGIMPSGSVTFWAGESAKTIVIPVNADDQPEQDEDFEVILGPVAASVSPRRAQGTIQDDDITNFTMSSSVSRGEGTNIAPVPFKFVVNRTGNVNNVVDLSFSVTPSGANPATDDGLPANGIVHFDAGQTKSYALVNVNADRTQEANETFTVTLGIPPAPNSTVNTLTGIGTIINDDVDLPVWPRPVVRGDPHLVTFDGLGYDFQAAGEFVLVQGTEDPGILIQVRTLPFGEAVSNITAIAALIDGHRVTFDSRSDQFLRVDGVAASIPEETGFIEVGNQIISFDGSSYIVLDSGRISFIVQDYGERLDLTLSTDGELAGKLLGLLGNYNEDTGDDLALADGTVLPLPLPFAELYGRFADSWRVTADNSLFDYAPGESTDTFTDSNFPRQAVTLDMLPAELVAWATELVDEAGITDPTVRAAAILDLALTGDLSFLASAAIPVEPKATLELIDTLAPLPILSVAALDAGQAEGDDGLTLFHFDVFRTGSTLGALNIAYQVAGSGLHSPDAVDFGGALPNGTVHFDDGQAKASITLAVIGDVALEYNESFALKIGVAEADKANVLIAAPSAGATIVNDDGDLPGLLAIRAVTGKASEGNSGVTVFSFDVVRSESTLAEARVDYIVQGIGDHPATGDDFAGGIYPGGTLIFMPGETRQTIILNIVGDTAIEPDEDFTVMLVNPVNVTLDVAMAGGTIVNDDVPPPPELSIAALDAVKAEGDLGTMAFTFKVTRTGDLNGETSVHFGVSGTVDGFDFAGGALPSGLLVFASGSAEQVIAFEVAGDTALEPDEHFTVTLTDPNNATLGTAAAIGTIVNDDVPSPPALRIMATDADRPEGNLGPTPFTFTVTRAGDTSVATSVDYTVNGVGPHAVDSNDFGGIFPSGTLSFAPGQNEQTLTVEVNGDTTVEPDEAFAVTLTNPQNGILEVAMASGTIRNDDVLPPPELSIAALDAVKAEGDSGITAFTFKVTRTGDLSGETSVHFGVSGEVDGLDFTGGKLPSGMLDFAPGSGEQLITLQVMGDTRVEPHKAFTLTLAEPVNGSLATSSAQGIIVNDDHFSIHIGDAPVRPPKSDAGAWERSWTDSHVDISHKANLADVNEAYSNVLFASSGSGVLNGGDISGGDLGVSGQTLATSAVKQEIDGTEGLRFSLDQEATGISFSLSRFFANDDGTGLNEAGRVQFFNLDQEIVKDVQFYASNAGGEKQMNIDVSEGFVEALFSAGASDGQNFVFGAYGNAAGNGYGEAPGAGHGSDYLVDAVTFEFGEVAVIGSILPNNPIDPFTI